MAKKTKQAASTGNLPTLDLHGFVVDEVPDAVDQFLRKHGNKPKIRIVTGKGTGKVKAAVLQYLKLGGFAWYYEPLTNGQKNEGALIIPMD